MKRLGILTLLLALLAIPATAQNMQFGLMLGGSDYIEQDDFEFNASDQVRELFVGFEMERGTWFKIKGGQIDSDDGPRFGAPGVEREGKVEYIDAIVEYNFSEVFGSSGLFAGPGFYRQRFGTLEESDWGLTAGLNVSLPVTRRLALVGELSYHWTAFEEDYTFLNIAGGAKLRF
jgi:hypothetical protein